MATTVVATAASSQRRFCSISYPSFRSLSWVLPSLPRFFGEEKLSDQSAKLAGQANGRRKGVGNWSGWGRVGPKETFTNGEDRKRGERTPEATMLAEQRKSTSFFQQTGQTGKGNVGRLKKDS